MRYERYVEKQPWRHRHEALIWTGSFLLMVGGTAWFVLDSSTLSYWLGTSLYVPFALMVVERGKRKGFTNDAPPDMSDNGPWSGP